VNVSVYIQALIKSTWST